MGTIERLLGAAARSRAAVLLRSHQAGDMGWVIYRHGVDLRRGIWLGHQLRGAGRRHLRRVPRALRSRGRTLLDRGADGESSARCSWCRKSKTVAKLRLLLVETEGARARHRPRAGRASASASRARRAIQDDAVDAKQARRRAPNLSGGRLPLVHSKPHRSFGHDLIGETWEREL